MPPKPQVFLAHPLKLNPRSAADIYIYIYISYVYICIYNIYIWIYVMINLIFIWKTSLENILSKFQFFWANSLCNYVIMICGVCSIFITPHSLVLEVYIYIYMCVCVCVCVCVYIYYIYSQEIAYAVDYYFLKMKVWVYNFTKNRTPRFKCIENFW